MIDYLAHLKLILCPKKQELVDRIATQIINHSAGVIHLCSTKLLNQHPDRFKMSLFIPDATESEVRTIILKLDNKKAAGYDNIKPQDLKDVLNYICEPITNMINLSLSSGYVPYELKRSIVRPVHKHGKMNDIMNYRPISLVPTIGKIMDRYIEKKIMKYLQKYRLIDSHQFGYQKNKGTITLLEQFTDNINTGLDKGLHTLCIFVDFSKAFDSINHSILIDCLEHVGIRGHIKDWIKSYISDRTYTVRIDDYESDQHILKRGVPQGSILGSLLYILYVNDVGQCFKRCEYFMYADDTAIMCKHRNLEDAIAIMQQEFDTFQLWAHDKQLNINASKTKLMHIRTPKYASKNTIPMVVHNSQCLHNQISNCKCKNHIELVRNYKYLGIIFDEHMLWRAHTERLKKQLRCLSFNFYYMRKYVPGSVLLTIYRSLVECILCYGITIYGQASKYLLDGIQRFQCAILKHIQNSEMRECVNIGDILNINQLHTMRTILNNVKYTNEWELTQHNRTTRSHERKKFTVAKYNNKYGQRRKEVFVRQIFNQIDPGVLASTSAKTLKEEIKKWVLTHIE